MKIEIQIFCVVFVLLVWLATAWEAFIKLSRGRLRRLELKKKDLAKNLEQYLDKRDAYDVVFRILVFLTIAVMAVTVFIVISQRRSWNLSLTQAAAIAAVGTLLLSISAEAIAKVLLFRFDLFFLKLTLPLIRIMHYSLFFPVVSLMQLIDEKIESIQDEEGAEEKATAEDEIMSLMESEDEDDAGALEEDEIRMIKGIFELDDTPVREIMTPRVDVTALPLTASVDEAKAEFIKSGHSRIPVYKDTVDEIRGILFAKDFLDEELIEGKELDELAHKPIFIPETKAVDDLLEEVKKTNNHFAVIIDEYGGTSGIVTFEDIIEEIVGEIRDEYDTDEDISPEPVKMPDGSVILDARTIISDVNELLESDIPENEDVDTIGGFVCGEFGKIPEPGEEADIAETIHVTVLKADKRRILTLKLKMEDQEDA